MNYRVYGTTTCTVSTIVSANNEEEAIEKANNEFSGISSFCGNGGIDKLIGVYEDDDTIVCDDEVIFTEAFHSDDD